MPFAFFAWATIIRPEGQFWFIAFSIAYLVRFRRKRKDLIMYLICLAVFLLVLSPIVMHRVECCESDMIFDRIVGEIKNYFPQEPIEQNENNIVTPEEPIEQNENIAYGPNWINGIKLFGWSLIPVFIIFVPIGLIPIFKHLKYPNYLLVLVPTVIAIPIMYSVSIAPDTRYVYPLFPIFCVISLFGIKWIVDNFDNKKLILGIIIFSIIIGSMIFLDFKKIDYGYDEKSYEISKIIIKDIKGVNDNSIAAQFFKLIEIENGGPIIESAGQISERYKINQIYAKPFTSLDEFIEFGKKEGVTHLVIDNNYNMQDFFIDVYDNEEKYQYLLKEYDSEEHGYNYHVKKFKINYEYFNEK